MKRYDWQPVYEDGVKVGEVRRIPPWTRMRPRRIARQWRPPTAPATIEEAIEEVFPDGIPERDDGTTDWEKFAEAILEYGEKIR